MASGLNKRKMIQHAVFKELVKVKVYQDSTTFLYRLNGKKYISTTNRNTISENSFLFL